MLQDNWALREKLQVLKEAKEQLNSAPLQAPKHKSLQNVLNHLYKTQKREKLAYATLYPKPAADIR
ncbi:hypothetical protein FLA_6108 [Filimonas lacunae]|nr:hypothetical protein FLA_6108 [Filimonas lacunae]